MVEAVDAPLARAPAPAAIACEARCAIRPPTSGSCPTAASACPVDSVAVPALTTVSLRFRRAATSYAVYAAIATQNAAQIARPTSITRSARAERNAGIDGMALVLPPH